jgi:putative transposase
LIDKPRGVTPAPVPAWVIPDRIEVSVTTHEDDDVARRARAQRVALFRYQLICPALDPGLSSKARGRVVRSNAAGTHTGPFGGQCCYSRDTLDRWIRRYRVGGFDALTPSIRRPGSRIDTTALELAVALKRENPERTAAQVARILRASSGWAPSESTLLRLFHRRDLIGLAAGDQPAVFGRFEAAIPNERWVGDALCRGIKHPRSRSRSADQLRTGRTPPASPARR